MSEKIYLNIKQRIKKLNYEEYNVLKELCKASKDPFNAATYIKRQNFFDNKIRIKDGFEPIYINYNDLYHLMKDMKEYKILNSNMSQQVLKLVDRNFKSFFALLKAKNNGTYNEPVKLPNYLDKEAFFSLIIGFVRIGSDLTFRLPMNNKYPNKIKMIFKVPPVLKGKVIKEIRIIPKQHARFFEIHYVYECDISTDIYNKNNALAIDLGINNLMICVTNQGQSFIIDGKKIKSINQYANKKNAKLRSILDKQKLKGSKQIDILWDKRNNAMHNYILKSCRYIINYCKENNIGNIVLGFNKDMTRGINLGKRNNQNIATLPMGKIKNTFMYMCQLENINFVTQEESFTSKASFWDKDSISKGVKFSGKRIKRGLYQTSDNRLINADVNAALNIMKKVPKWKPIKENHPIT